MPAGDRIYASDAARIVGRGRRTTATAPFTTTETPVLRIDNIPVFDRRAYHIFTSNFNTDVSVANDVMDTRIRGVQAATPGTVATTASPMICHRRDTIDSAGDSNILPISGMYYPTADGYLSILMTSFRQSGTGNCIVFCSLSDILDMVVMDVGDDPGDTGVVL